MPGQFEVAPAIEHEYVVRADVGAETIESWFHIDPAVTERLGVADVEEWRVVEQTAVFLASKQPVADFPKMVDLEDVIAAYPDYPQTLRQLVTA